MRGVTDALLSTILAGTTPAFALLHRPSMHADLVEVLSGDVVTVGTIAELPLPRVRSGGARHDLLALLPYRQITERGYACHDDGAPLLAMTIRDATRVSVAAAVRDLPDGDAHLVGGGFDVDDRGYADTVRRVVADEIGGGAGSNFVIRRSYRASTNRGPRAALPVFRRLLQTERGAYWTFLFHDGNRSVVGATPERHISVHDGVARMTPVSGTYRYPESGPTIDGLLRFLGDRKEIDELSMVLDEELKMMAQVCGRGGRVVGPSLREMARLAHTEYLIEGATSLDVRDILRATMFAPTVTGSPLESACRVIEKYERGGRGYYGGVLALVGQYRGARCLDAAILIRTAHLSGGQVEIGAGATLVRHSDAAAEVAETVTKLAAIRGAFDASPAATSMGTGVLESPTLGADPSVGHALAQRNARLAAFWRQPASRRDEPVAALSGRRIVVVDAEDAFTAMLAHQLRALGPRVVVRSYQEVWRVGDCDAVVVGPGPGDPRDFSDPKIARLRDLTACLIKQRVPLLSVCLGHQVVAALMGLPLRRRQRPAQGTQREIVVGGRRVRVAAYHTFAAYSDASHVACPLTRETVVIDRDATTGEVYALSKPGVRSVQFHPESVLTEDGPAILTRLLSAVLGVAMTADIP